MNILPKKRWHVRTKENIARVRKDEAKAAEEERIKQERAQKAETEARIDFLREKARSKYDGREDTSKAEEASTSKLEHVNFFADLEQGIIDYNKPNAEHEKEKKEEKEKYEKQIGYLTYLGQDTNEATGKKNWYEELPRRITDTEKNIEVQPKKKALDDPIQDIRKYLNIMGAGSGEKSLKTKSVSIKRVKEESEDSDYDHKSGSSKKHKHKKSKKHKKDKHYSKETVNREKPTMDIAKLRAERLLREQSEKLRAEALLAKIRGDPVPVVAPETPSKPVIKQKYNSQFFPEIARQNAEKTPNVHSLKN
ncbi:leukocyte receptor cluster member 1 [Lasioglossum baleicum]|uniref:leukocyte receptor cluster member 1 n=1 Tax=Lasioglossum baleicum TaxID=434251 RepID=UPI003FCD0EFB